jgi:diguanylate cyclase (GGDEF)-like protein
MINSYFALPKYRDALFLMLALPVLYLISRYNYNLFHSFVDGISIVIAATVFTIIWNGRRILDNDYFLFVGIAFLFFAFWDLMHLLGNKNMGVFPEYGNLGPTLYIVSRYTLSISLMIAALFIRRKLNITFMFAVYSLMTLFILLTIFHWHIFPVCIVEGVGLTPFKVISDYIICLILLGAIGLLLVNRRSFDSRVLWIIIASIGLSIAAGLAFTLYKDPFDIMNAVGHFFQIASFFLVYLALIETSLTKPQDILYRKLKENEKELAESLQQLDSANVVLKQEITDRKQAERALRESEKRYRELSIVDDLTQIYNTRYFYQQLRMEIDRVNRYGQPLTLLLLDLDDFKAFNDAYGHVEGDQVLVRVGQVIKRWLRQTDSAYRYGGEEFTILLPMTTGTDGMVTAERIRTEFKKEIFTLESGEKVHITVSIGLAQYRPKEEMKAFVHRVDHLMYQGKRSGKDRVCSNPLSSG